MRIKVAHQITSRYERPAKSVIQLLRLTPRSHEGQHIVRWRVDVSPDARLTVAEDAFGNITHTFSMSGPVEMTQVRVEGEVETQDRAGVVRGAVERFPASLYLRETDATRSSETINAFARNLAASHETQLARCHALTEAIHDRMHLDRDRASQQAPSLAALFEAGTGNAQDLAHLFICCARYLAIPSRYVSGLLCVRESDRKGENARHGWAESHIEGLGWVGFDPSLQICPSVNHIRVAVGLDGLGAAPSRSAFYGGEGESLEIQCDVHEKATNHQAERQGQS